MKKLIFITLMTSFYITNMSVAEDRDTLKIGTEGISLKEVALPSTAPTASEDHIDFSPYQQKKVNYYQFLVDMLTSKINLYDLKSQKKKDNSEDKNSITALQDKLSVAYEALTELFCMPYLYTTLEYKGSPTNSICLKYLKEIKNRVPDSPIIPCVELGIDDPECISKYNDQYFSTFDISKLSSDDINLKDKVEYQKKEPEISKLLYSIQDKKEQYNSLISLQKTKSLDSFNLRKDLKKDYAKLLELQCSVELTRITHKEPENITKFKVTPKENIADPDFYALLETIPDIKKTIEDNKPKKINNNTLPQGEDKKVWRIRLINDDCKKSIDSALSMFNDFPYAICAYYGKLTPNCIQAWRKYKTQLEKDKKELLKKSTPSGSGFSTF